MTTKPSSLANVSAKRGMGEGWVGRATVIFSIPWLLTGCDDITRFFGSKDNQQAEVAIAKARPIPSEPALNAHLVFIGHPDEFMGENYLAIAIEIANQTNQPITHIKGRFDFQAAGGVPSIALAVNADGNLAPHSATRILWKWSAWANDASTILRYGSHNYVITFVPTEIVLGDGSKIKAQMSDAK